MRETVIPEPGTLHRIRQAGLLGDVPEDAPSTKTLGILVRRFRMIDMLSILHKSRHITFRQYEAGIQWREAWYNSGSSQRVVSKMEPPVSGKMEGYMGRTLDARRRYEKASQLLGPRFFSFTFGVCMMDEAARGRTADLREALDLLADHFGI